MPHHLVEIVIAGNVFLPTPNVVTVSPGERVIWTLRDVPAGFQPHLDFVEFRGGAQGPVVPVSKPPFDQLVLDAETIVSGKADGPEGDYWYQLSLMPDRSLGDDGVLRLDCRPDAIFDGIPGAGVRIPPS